MAADLESCVVGNCPAYFVGYAGWRQEETGS